MQLAELLALPTFSDFELIAGETGLGRDIGNVDILEYEYFTQKFGVFSENDFVLTSLFFAKDDPTLIGKSIEKLLAQHISALAVKTVFYTKLPDEVIDLCNAHKLPLFTFQHAYMEDLIVSFNELQKSDQRNLLLEENLHFLLQTTADKSLVESTAHEINPAFLAHAVAFYLTDRQNPHSPRRIATVLNRLLYKQYRYQQLYYVSYLKYDNGLLVIYTQNDAQLAEPPQALIGKLLRSYDIKENDFYIGCSNCHPTFTRLHQLIQESLDANLLCQQQDAACVSYSDLGVYRQLLPLSRQLPCREQLQTVVQTLQTYDSKFSSRLLETLLTYVRNGGEVARTAQQLYQHPNTIRYRLTKARELLAPCLGTEHFYEQIFNLLTIYQLQLGKH